MLFGNRRTSNL